MKQTLTATPLFYYRRDLVITEIHLRQAPNTQSTSASAIKHPSNHHHKSVETKYVD